MSVREYEGMRVKGEPNPQAFPSPLGRGQGEGQVSRKTARVVEIFSSLQGEGLFVGVPMIFIRFGGCNLRCNYCDEPDTLPLDSGNLMTVKEICQKIKVTEATEAKKATEIKIPQPLSPIPVKWISLTGGEPLLQGPFLVDLAPELKKMGYKIYLETNGIFHEKLAVISNEIDFISMDLKLPSTVQGQDWFKRHQCFLDTSAQATSVKIVLTQNVTKEEIMRSFKLLKNYPQIKAVILQPATPRENIYPPRERIIQTFHSLALSMLKVPIKVMPQYHPIWGIP